MPKANKYMQHLVLKIHQAPNECLDVHAIIKGFYVGEIGGLIEGKRLNLTNFKVYNDAPIGYPFAHSLIVSLWGSCRKRNFRGIGIGSRLLTCFIDEARKLGIHEIWGSVVEPDEIQTHYLLTFYQKYGFSITEPDTECLDNAKWKIVKNPV